MDCFVFAVIICCVGFASGEDNGLQIDFHRILEPGYSQTIEQIQVDSSSTDTFQVKCTVRKVNQLDVITTLRVQYKTSANAQDFTDLAILQNFNANSADTYRKPVLASGAGSGWTPEGSFDTTSSNGRNSTLGVSRPVSSITCSNAVMYRCRLDYLKPGFEFETAIVSKELDVQASSHSVLPTTITRQVYNMSGLSSEFQINLTDTIEPFYVGQTVRMECSANIGSYNGTAQIRWLKSNIVAGKPLAPFYSTDAVIGDPNVMGNCDFEKTDSVTYNMTAQDASRTANNRLHFQCYVSIYGNMSFETPEELRQNFTFIVYSADSNSGGNPGAPTADNGLQIEFQRILQPPGGSQTIEHIEVDSSSTDTFQVMCRVNNVNQLFKITTLKIQYKTSTNTKDFTDLAILQNIDHTNADTYQKPVLASDADSWWTVEGNFDSNNSNGRDNTLGVSRPVSLITCNNAREYRCHLFYTNPGPEYFTAYGIISKELDVHFLPTTITRQVFNMSDLSSAFPINLTDPIEPFYVGQTVNMECSANIGSYNGTAQIRWLKSNLVAGSPLAPYYSPDAVVGDAQATGNCVYQQADSVTYNMTAKDAGRTAESRLQFQCYVFIPSVNWETPEEQRQNFSFYVYTTEEGGSDSATTADNGLQIDFQRILEAGGSQTIEQIQVDNSSTDTIQVMCKVNNVDQLFKINNLRLQYKTSANAPDFTDLAFLQNVDDTNGDTYQKPVLASGADSGWTVEGSFDTTSSNGRDSTLGVSRLVSSITCSNAVEYSCYISYKTPGLDYSTETGIISKELDVQVLPTTITRNVYNTSSLSTSLPIALSDTIGPFYVGQTVKIECSANIGSYNGTAQIRWFKSNLVPGSPLAPYYSQDAVIGDAQALGNCLHQQTDSVTYNMTAQDAGRTAENRLNFQCYVYIPSMNWETPVDQRQNFRFIVHMKEAGGADSATTTDTGLNRTTNGVTTQRTTQPDNQNLINGVEVKAVNIVALFSMTTISVLMFLTK